MKNKKCQYIIAAAALLLPLMLFLQHAFAKEEKKVAYLTFDDGPTLNTPDIVDTLSRYNAKATFFVLEERIKLYPDFIKKIAHSGNSIGLHGISHSEAIYENEISPLEEMKKTEKTLRNLLGSGSKLVRVPFGSGYRLTKAQAGHLTDNGYIIWDWNVDPRDSVGKIVAEKVMGNLRRGLSACDGAPVILLHDRKSTLRMLPIMLEYLAKEGYTLLPINEKQTPITRVLH